MVFLKLAKNFSNVIHRFIHVIHSSVYNYTQFMHNLVKKVVVNSFLLILSFTVFLPLTAEALTVSPSITDVQLENFAQETGNFEVTNTSDEVFAYEISIGTFSQDEKGLPLLEMKNDFSSWISGIPRTFELGPQEKRVISYSITPNAPRPGSYFFSFFVSERPKSSVGGDVSTASTIVSLLFVNVGTSERQNLEVTSFSPKSAIVWTMPQDFLFTAKNVGTIFSLPQGELRVAPLWRGKIYAAPLFLQKRVLPNVSREFEATWNPQGLWWSSLNPFRFGVYDVDLVLQNTDYHGTVRTRFILLSPSGILVAVLFIMYYVWRFVYYKKPSL